MKTLTFCLLCLTFCFFSRMMEASSFACWIIVLFRFELEPKLLLPAPSCWNVMFLKSTD